MQMQEGASQSGRHSTIAEEARKYLATWDEAGLWSGVALLARGDSILFTGGFGFADARNQRPNEAGTRYRIGSVTKSMMWAAIQALSVTGQLDLDASVSSIIGEPKMPATLTVRHLLNRRGGIAYWSAFDDATRVAARASTVRDLAAWIASKPLHFQPGASRHVLQLGLHSPRAGAMVRGSSISQMKT